MPLTASLPQTRYSVCFFIKAEVVITEKQTRGIFRALYEQHCMARYLVHGCEADRKLGDMYKMNIGEVSCMITANLSKFSELTNFFIYSIWIILCILSKYTLEIQYFESSVIYRSVDLGIWYIGNSVINGFANLGIRLFMGDTVIN